MTYREEVRIARKHFVHNAWEPIAIPRWALSLKYVLFFFAATVAFIVGVPTLSLTTFVGYEPIWSAGIGLGSFLAFCGSIKAAYAALEAWGEVILLSFLTVLIIELCARSSFAVAVLLTVVTIVPLVRAGYLITRWVYRYRRLDVLNDGADSHSD